jgi:hypothetical protein
MAIPVKAAARKVGIAIVLCRGIGSDRLQVPDVQEAGPAIFAIDEAKNDVMEPTPLLIAGHRLQPFCCRRISSAAKIDFVERENGFRKVASLASL